MCLRGKDLVAVVDGPAAPLGDWAGEIGSGVRARNCLIMSSWDRGTEGSAAIG